MKRIARLGFVLGVVVVALAGCYVVPAPPPAKPGAGPPPPAFVQATPQCRWQYGMGWYGWGWYSGLC